MCPLLWASSTSSSDHLSLLPSHSSTIRPSSSSPKHPLLLVCAMLACPPQPPSTHSPTSSAIVAHLWKWEPPSMHGVCATATPLPDSVPQEILNIMSLYPQLTGAPARGTPHHLCESHLSQAWATHPTCWSKPMLTSDPISLVFHVLVSMAPHRVYDVKMGHMPWHRQFEQKGRVEATKSASYLFKSISTNTLRAWKKT